MVSQDQFLDVPVTGVKEQLVVVLFFRVPRQSPAADLRVVRLWRRPFSWLFPRIRIRFSDVSKISSRDQVLHEVPVPKIVLQDRVQRWNAEQSAEFPALPDIRERKKCRGSQS